MDYIEKIVIAVLAFAITSFLAYLFRVRQLYAAVTKLYGASALSASGTLSELVVCNRGKQVEEDISLEFGPDVKAEILAASASGVSLTEQALTIPRMHKGERIAVMLLVESGQLDMSDISRLSSKQTSGHVYPSEAGMPSNHASSFMAVIAIVLLGAALWNFPSRVDYALDRYVEMRRTELRALGWENLNEYHWSDLASSYKSSEFPIRFLRMKKGKNGTSVGEFEIVNKSSLPLKVSAYPTESSDKKSIDPDYFETTGPVLPMEKTTFDVPIKPDKTNPAFGTVQFSLNWDEQFIFGIRRTFSLEEEAS